MKTTNVIRFVALAALLLIMVIISNCADPLDITNQPVPPNQNPTDTTYLIDTLYVIDTVTQTHFDTTIVLDTVYNGTVDTVTIVDTVTQTHFDTTYVVDTVVHGHVDTVVVVDTVTQNHYDTTYVVDTVTNNQIDTIMVIDTVIVSRPDTVAIVDTIYQTDTLTIVDTIYVANDTSQLLCGRIESCQKEIVWLLQNEPGQYHLSFASLIEKNQPPQSLTVQIGDSAFSWNTATDDNLSVDMWLAANATITITSQKPPARGHAVYICLSMTRE